MPVDFRRSLLEMREPVKDDQELITGAVAGE